MQDASHHYYSIFDQPNRTRHEWLNFFWHHGNALCHPSILVRKKCYDECGFYRNGLAQLPDLDMWVRLCMQYEIRVIPDKLVRFRVRSDEMQISGNRPETRIRVLFEQLQVLDNYLKIASYSELVKVFPAAEKYHRAAGCDIGYVLGMLALETQSANPAVQLFGLEQLFTAISDPVRAANIKELYGFAHKDFIALTARYDVFSGEAISRLSSRLAEQQRAVEALVAEVGEKAQAVQAASAQVAEIERSKAWRVAMALRRLRLAVLPAQSARARTIRRFLKRP
jgi:hypothetical protein